jgi:hypothetical protein
MFCFMRTPYAGEDHDMVIRIVVSMPLATRLFETLLCSLDYSLDLVWFFSYLGRSITMFVFSASISDFCRTINIYGSMTIFISIQIGYPYHR